MCIEQQQQQTISQKFNWIIVIMSLVLANENEQMKIFKAKEKDFWARKIRRDKIK